MARSLPPPDRSIPIDMRGVRSGYVYVAQSPDRLDACKVGHTTRPPHARMEELGKTTWLSPMRVFSARFFWDALTAERQLHKALAAFRQSGTEEWFNVPASQVAHVVTGWEEPARPPHPSRRSPEEYAAPQWRALRLEWAMEDIASDSKRRQADGWRDVERLSCLGHAPATWLVAERVLVEAPMHPERALWVLEAASRQGCEGAVLRRDWVASLTASDPTRRRWKESVRAFLEKMPDPQSWNEEDRKTLAQELRLWGMRPSLAWSPALPGLLGQG